MRRQGIDTPPPGPKLSLDGRGRCLQPQCNMVMTTCLNRMEWRDGLFIKPNVPYGAPVKYDFLSAELFLYRLFERKNSKNLAKSHFTFHRYIYVYGGLILGSAASILDTRRW